MSAGQSKAEPESRQPLKCHPYDQGGEKGGKVRMLGIRRQRKSVNTAIPTRRTVRMAHHMAKGVWFMVLLQWRGDVSPKTNLAQAECV